MARELVGEGSAGDVVSEAQQALKDLGFDPGAIDGAYGPATDAAIRAFQSAKGLEVDGVIGDQTWAALDAAKAAVAQAADAAAATAAAAQAEADKAAADAATAAAAQAEADKAAAAAAPEPQRDAAIGSLIDAVNEATAPKDNAIGSLIDAVKEATATPEAPNLGAL